MEGSLLLKHVESEYQRLWMEQKLIRSIEESSDSITPKQLELLQSKESVSALLQFHEHLFDKLSEGLSSSLSESDSKERTDQERFLCVTDGYMIICLDMKQQQRKDPLINHRKQQPLPIITSLKFSEHGYPVSMALFKVRSNAYMVGGHEYIDNDYPKDKKSLFSFYNDSLVDNSSPKTKTYHLSLGDNNRLSLSECGTFGSLNEPKWWPIVEKIDESLHVIESVPRWVHDPPVYQSHEVLNLDDLTQGWIKLSPKVKYRARITGPGYTEFQNHTWSHLVVGDKLYGSACRDRFDTFHTFDSKMNEWMLKRPMLRNQIPDLFSIKNVGHLVHFGFGKCIGKFLEGDGMLLYMVIALGKVGALDSMSAVAYLVTPIGQILCYQRLPLIFGGFLPLFDGDQCTVISVDEEEKTFCAIVRGEICKTGISLGKDLSVLHVSTFSAEKCLSLPRACALASSLLAQASDDIDEQPLAVEKEFVKVRVKDWSAFEFKDVEMIHNRMGRMSACFL